MLLTACTVLHAVLCPQSPQFAAPVMLEAGGEAIRLEAPGFAAPCWHDVDGDGRKDLVVGHFAKGRMKFYRNTGDGDLDMRSGSSPGGASLFANVGTVTAPKWAEPVILLQIDASERKGGDIAFGDAHIKGPQSGRGYGPTTWTATARSTCWSATW